MKSFLCLGGLRLDSQMMEPICARRVCLKLNTTAYYPQCVDGVIILFSRNTLSTMEPALARNCGILQHSIIREQGGNLTFFSLDCRTPTDAAVPANCNKHKNNVHVCYVMDKGTQKMIYLVGIVTVPV